jgi:hypothetical protein
MRESALLRAVLDYLQLRANQGALLYLRLNSGNLFPVSKTGKSYRVKLCPAGTPDVVVIRGHWLYWPDLEQEWHPDVIFIETKAPRGKLSPAQEQFKVMAESQGCEYMVVRDVDEVIRRLE